jgi:hypothetical protein
MSLENRFGCPGYSSTGVARLQTAACIRAAPGYHHSHANDAAFAGLRDLGEPARRALVAQLAGGEAAVRAYYLTRELVAAGAPIIGWVLWEFASPAVAYGVAFLVGSAGALWYAWRSAGPR